MDNIPLWAQALLIILLLLCSAFFSTSETSMMSLNKHRLNFLANQGNKRAKRTQKLLERTEDVLSAVLIGNNIINTLVTVLVTTLAVSAFGDNQTVLSITTAIVSCLIIICCEIIPKVLGASFSQSIAFKVSGILRMIVIAIYPIIISINKIVNLLFKVLSINTQEQQTVTPQEIRSMVLDSSIFSLHYRNILLNFFDLEAISINDVMTPKSKIECININQDVEIIIKQLKTCYHNKLLVYEKNIDKPIGILHVRKTISYIEENELTTDIIRNLLTEIYYIPQHISAIKQLQYFQDRQERMGVIVDEYGEIQGLVTLEDILEQLVGEFTTSIPRLNNYTKDKDGYYVLDASINIRELNRDLKTKFDTDGAKTLNGMLIEYLQDIPDSDICVKINNVIIEITQTDEYAIKSVKLKV
ncbi:MAG: hypothetical protein RLZZ210_17 [Pseudomonadota bacterium]|jgi:Mg2+/Co2+ transporter CorB